MYWTPPLMSSCAVWIESALSFLLSLYDELELHAVDAAGLVDLVDGVLDALEDRRVVRRVAVAQVGGVADLEDLAGAACCRRSLPPLAAAARQRQGRHGDQQQPHDQIELLHVLPLCLVARHSGGRTVVRWRTRPLGGGRRADFSRRVSSPPCPDGVSSSPLPTAVHSPATMPHRDGTESSRMYSDGEWSSPPTGPSPSSVGTPAAAVQQPSDMPPLVCPPRSSPSSAASSHGRRQQQLAGRRGLDARPRAVVVDRHGQPVVRRRCGRSRARAQSKSARAGARTSMIALGVLRARRWRWCRRRSCRR